MSAINHIKRGIENGNWSDVCLGIEELTGEKCQEPKNSINNINYKLTDEEKIWFADEIIKIITNLQYKTEEKKVKSTTKKDKKKKNNKKKKSSKITKSQIKDDNENLDDFKEVVVPTKQTTKFGNKSFIIGDEPDPEMVEINEKIMDGRKGLAVKRPPHKDIEVECSDCGDKFISNIKVSKELGQRCKKCLKNLPKDR